MKKTKNGEIRKLAEGKFGFIRWLTCTKNGSLYFTENNKLHRLSPDGNSDSYRMETLANNIGSKSTDFSMMGRNYDSYGIWTDAAGNIYLAMINSKKVIRIGADGNPQTILASNSLWTVCSGIFDNNGNMWVLENSLSNEVRARKIGKEELTGNKTASNFTTNATFIYYHLYNSWHCAFIFRSKNDHEQKETKLLQLPLKNLYALYLIIFIIMVERDAGDPYYCFFAYDQFSMIDIVSFATMTFAGFLILFLLIYLIVLKLKIIRSQETNNSFTSRSFFLCLQTSCLFSYRKNMGDLYGRSEATLFITGFLTSGFVFGLFWAWKNKLMAKTLGI